MKNMLREMYDGKSYMPEINQKHFEMAYKQKEYLNISKYEEHMLKNWFKYDGCFYYLKYTDSLNELIGERIAKKINLRSASYIPVLKDGCVLIASRNFKKMNCKYLNVEELEKKLNIFELLDDSKYSIIRNQLFKLFSLDIFMRQKDRSIPNLLFEVNTENNLSLAPIFDYSNAFNGFNYDKYDNPIKDIYLDKIKFDKLMNEYPELYKYIKNISKIDLEQIILEICDEFDLTLIDSVRDYYLTKEEQSKKILKKVLN